MFSLHFFLSLLSANQSPSYPSPGGGASSRPTSGRPESFLYRLGQREEKRKGAFSEALCSDLPVRCAVCDSSPSVLQEMCLLRAGKGLLQLLLCLERMLNWWSSSERCLLHAPPALLLCVFFFSLTSFLSLSRTSRPVLRCRCLATWEQL